MLEAGPGPDDFLFREGAAAGAFGLGDEVDAAGRPVGWAVGDRPETTPDLFVVLGGETEAVVAGRGVTPRGPRRPRRCCLPRGRRRLDGDTEHFGFVDGISQPGVRGTVDGVAPLTERAYPDDHPLAAAYARPGQPLVWPGQFVFGYPTQRADDPSPGHPQGKGDPLLENGSILVFRRLRQDVAGFRTGMERLVQAFAAKGLTVDAATAGAWCVGRWPDGTPLTLSPSRPDAEIASDTLRRNGFWYDEPLTAATLHDRSGASLAFPGAGADPGGQACPFFAHIRKVNPRDQIVDQGSNGVTLRLQMLRRGIPYGRPWPGAEDGADRGLLFMAYQTSIENQFQRLMKLWVNNAHAPPPGEGIDPVIGVPPTSGGRPLIRRRTGGVNPAKVLLSGRWVTTTGAGYFFAPGIDALRRIVAGPTA